MLYSGLSQSQTVQLVKGPGLNSDAKSILDQLKQDYPDLIIVDYTHPSATINNVQCYQDCLCDFVMGTTGGDPELILNILGEDIYLETLSRVHKILIGLVTTIYMCQWRHILTELLHSPLEITWGSKIELFGLVMNVRALQQ